MSLRDLPDQSAGPDRLEKDILGAVAQVARYLRNQRGRFLQGSRTLSENERGVMTPFFSVALLDSVRIVEMTRRRLDDPPFYAMARARGFFNLPEVRHMASLTFEEVVVFQEKLTDRILFHGLVHVAQFRLLGLERYAELFVRSFVRVRSHCFVPLEAQAFALDSRFAVNSERGFSVEDEVLKWIWEGLYA
ncbi:MAG: hypothetical protein WCE61_11140 [Candidatus Acidiferrum sp.]